VFAGALNERGTAGVIVTGAADASPLPPLGRLDPAPAMFHTRASHRRAGDAQSPVRRMTGLR
jgi:hypothetical protein